MSTTSSTPNTKQQPSTDQENLPIEPGHVMPREQYEELVRKAAGQK